LDDSDDDIFRGHRRSSIDIGHLPQRQVYIGQMANHNAPNLSQYIIPHENHVGEFALTAISNNESLTLTVGPIVNGSFEVHATSSFHGISTWKIRHSMLDTMPINDHYKLEPVSKNIKLEEEEEENF
jgi:hypothetical protein